MENFHLPTVHQKTIGGIKAEWNPIDGTPGNYVILQTFTAALACDARQRCRVRPIPTLRGPAAQGAQYILIYPCTVIGADLDCVWFKQMAPDGPGVVRYSAGFCFPKVTRRAAGLRADRAELPQALRPRDQRGQRNCRDPVAGARPIRSAGPARFSNMEPLVHAIDNWILDRVVGSAAGRAARRRPNEAGEIQAVHQDAAAAVTTSIANQRRATPRLKPAEGDVSVRRQADCRYQA